jgi:trigger factor
VKVTKTDNSPSNVTLLLSADAADLAPIKRHVLSHFTDKVKIPGFRAGKAPIELVEKHANQQALLDEFMEHALNDLFRSAVESQAIRPIGQPDVKLKKFVPYTNLEFEATIDILPKVKLPDYTKIKLVKPKVEVTAKDINDVLESLKTRVADRAPVDRAAKISDEVTIDFAGKDSDGKAVAGADGKAYPLTIGSKAFIPGFEENLIGLKAGDKKEFNITFPKDYGVAALQSKKVSFTVDVKSVSEIKQPKLDDDFAKKVGPFKDLAELKADIKSQVKLEKEAQATQTFENDLIKKITEQSKVDVPNGLIEEQIDRMEEQERQNLTYRGITWQEHLEQEGITQEQHRDRQRDDALLRVKGGLVLAEIAEAEGIKVTGDEVDMRIQLLKNQYQDPKMQVEIDNPANRRDIESRLLTEKTVQKLVSYASK